MVTIVKTRNSNSQKLLFFFIGVFFSLQVNAQEQIKFNGNILKKEIFKNYNSDQLSDFSTEYKDYYYLAIQFEKIPLQSQKEHLQSEGLEFIQYLRGNSYFAAISKSFPLEKLKPFNLKFSTINYSFKEDKSIRDLSRNENAKNRITISIAEFMRDDFEEVLAFNKIKILNKGSNQFKIESDIDFIEKLKAIPYVLFITSEEESFEILDQVHVQHGANKVNSNVGNGYGLTGDDVIIGIADVGPYDDQHIDFNDRQIVTNYPYNFVSTTYHGNHVTGIAAGNGNLDEAYRGVAPGADLITSSFSYFNIRDYAQSHGMVISNHSYTGGFDYDGDYTSSSNVTDKWVEENPNNVEVWALGNSTDGFGSSMEGPNSSKNVLSVSGSRMTANGLSRWTQVSYGPTADGRVKPEVCAEGMCISTKNRNDYRSAGGTSMAAPAVSGALSLMYELYKELNGGANPKGGLMKAILSNSADDYGNFGPDYSWGFGNLNVNNAIENIIDGNYFEGTIAQAENNQHTLNIPAGTTQVKVMLYYNDKEAMAFCNPCLINDLDLKLTSPSNSSHLPLILDPMNPADPAVEGVDRLNNSIQVIINNPEAGNYTIDIDGFSVPEGPQEYFIAYEFIETSLEILHPFEGDKLISKKNTYLFWEDDLSSSESYTIEYSDDGGSSWNLIESNYSLAANEPRVYVWNAPDVNSDGMQIRISTSSKSHTSGSFTMNQRIQLNENILSYDQDEVSFSWTAIPNAIDYNIYHYKAGMETVSLVGSTNDLSFVLTNLDPYEENFISVAPQFANNEGLRSVSSKPSAPRYYVDDDATGNNTGTSWDNAFNSITEALIYGAEEIWVAEGTYNPNRKDLQDGARYQLKAGIDLIGGFPNPSSFSGGDPQLTDRDWKLYPSIIDCFEATYKAIILEDGCTLDGFVIKNQTSTKNEATVSIKAESQKLENIIIRNVHFENITGASGAGIYVSTIQKADINLTLENLIFDNITGNVGAAIFVKAVSLGSNINLDINRVEINNTNVSHSVIFNEAKSAGTINANIQNLLIQGSNNSSLYFKSWKPKAKFFIDLNHVTISNSNTPNASIVSDAQASGFPSELDIRNSIIWDDNPINHMDQGKSDVRVSFSSLKGGTCPNAVDCCLQNQLDMDPLFVDAIAGDLRLSSGSPAINQGSPSDIILFDSDNNNRPEGAAVDLGAFETSEINPSPSYVTLLTPLHRTTLVSLASTFEWTAMSDALEYHFELSEDVDFQNILESSIESGTTYNPSVSLDYYSQYFWRVKPVFSCGEGVWTKTSNFVTENDNCLDIVDSENFETNWGIWNDGGNNSARVNNDGLSYSGKFSVKVQGRTQSSFTETDILDLSNFDNITVDFSFETQRFEIASHDFWLQISTDGGVNFTTIKDFNYSIDFLNDTRYFESVNIIGPFTNQTVIKFRCHASHRFTRVYFDDIHITGCPTSNSNLNDLEDRTSLQENIQNRSELNIFPTPAHQNLHLESNEDIIQLDILSMDGKLLKRISECNKKMIIDIGDLHPDVYILKSYTDKEMLVQKFIKM